MIDKSVVEQYLRANGVAPTAPDEQIKEVLFSAKWHEDDVDTALMVLRENPETNETHVDSLHKVYHSDERLKPETISALFGIDVAIDPPKQKRKSGSASIGSIIMVLFVAIVLSSALVVGAMWHLQMGIFFGGS